MVEIREHAIAGVYEITPRRHLDERGFFSETWNRAALEVHGISLDFVQDNHSLSNSPGVLRGLHFQVPPFAQDKLIRVVRGAIFDVAVDLRAGSSTFGSWIGVEISADTWNQLLIPRGLAHGFLTLQANTEVIYKVTAPYSAEHERSIRFDDPDIGVAWPELAGGFLLSAKDRSAPFLKDVDTGFQPR